MAVPLPYLDLYNKFDEVLAILVMVFAGLLYSAIILLYCGVNLGRKQTVVRVIMSLSFLVAVLLIWVVVR